MLSGRVETEKVVERPEERSTVLTASFGNLNRLWLAVTSLSEANPDQRFVSTEASLCSPCFLCRHRPSSTPFDHLSFPHFPIWAS